VFNTSYSLLKKVTTGSKKRFWKAPILIPIATKQLCHTWPT